MIVDFSFGSWKQKTVYALFFWLFFPKDLIIRFTEIILFYHVYELDSDVKMSQLHFQI